MKRSEWPEPILHDAAGHAIRVGDVVGGSTAGYYGATIIGPVKRLGKDRVKVGVTSRSNGAWRPRLGSSEWIDTDRVFIVAPRDDAYPDTPAPRCACFLTPHAMTLLHTDDCPALPPNAPTDTPGESP